MFVRILHLESHALRWVEVKRLTKAWNFMFNSYICLRSIVFFPQFLYYGNEELFFFVEVKFSTHFKVATQGKVTAHIKFCLVCLRKEEWKYANNPLAKCCQMNKMIATGTLLMAFEVPRGLLMLLNEMSWDGKTLMHLTQDYSLGNFAIFQMTSKLVFVDLS